MQRDAGAGKRRMLAVGEAVVVEHGHAEAAQVACALELDAQIAQIDHRLGEHALDPARLGSRAGFALSSTRCAAIPWSEVMTNSVDSSRPARAEQLEHGADSLVGAIERFAHAVMMRAVVVTGAVGEDEFVRDDTGGLVAAMLEQSRSLAPSRGCRRFPRAPSSACWSGRPSRAHVRRHLRGQRSEASLVPDDSRSNTARSAPRPCGS